MCRREWSGGLDAFGLTRLIINTYTIVLSTVKTANGKFSQDACLEELIKNLGYGESPIRQPPVSPTPTEAPLS